MNSKSSTACHKSASRCMSEEKKLNCKPSLAYCCVDALLLGPRLIKVASDALLKAFEEKLSDPGCTLCTIPETDCPPRCVCVIRWSGHIGDTVTHHIRVTNTGNSARDFDLVALPFPCSNEKVTLSSTHKSLKPGETLTSDVSFKIPEAFAGSCLQTEILVRGAYEQCIRVELEVSTRHESCCDIHQGEIPVRVRAHHWYDHFQCEEQCFEPIDSKGTGGLKRGGDLVNVS